jgi:hypothetical protein
VPAPAFSDASNSALNSGGTSIADPGRRRAEIPEDNNNNHALSALRFLIAKLDARKLGRKPKPPSTPPLPESTEKPKEKKWLSLKNEELWSQMWTVAR